MRKKSDDDICRVCQKDRRLHKYLESLRKGDWNYHIAIYDNLEYLEHEEKKNAKGR